ncbi:MAG: photosynthetic reaction center subunit H [Pseudomonadota bacterium]
MTETIFGNFDLALISLYLFWLFFIGLVVWLQRENMREGYPLVDADGKPAGNQGPYSLPYPKTFKLPHGRGELTVPDAERELARDAREIAAERTTGFPGDPLEPTGDPLVDGVGPAAWCERRDEPELDGHGNPKIVPMRAAEEFLVAAGQRDPRGLPVIAGDGETVGTISDMWIDRPEMLIRYLEIELSSGGNVIVPMTLAKISAAGVKVYSLHSHQFANVPRTAAPDRVTLLEEDKISAYYCGGKLYATKETADPLL